jgi:3' exoribonuclease, RNase T-like
MEKLHAMLDIETLGTGTNCVVLSIAAVQFDNKGKLFNSISLSLNIDQQQELGRQIDSGTLKWWLDQKHEVLKKQLKDPTNLEHALNRLALITKDCCVWSNGASFDIPIVASLYRQLSLPIPWDFWNERCVRTVIALGGLAKGPKPTDAHDPLADCIYQVQEVIKTGLVK